MVFIPLLLTHPQASRHGPTGQSARRGDINFKLDCVHSSCVIMSAHMASRYRLVMPVLADTGAVLI